MANNWQYSTGTNIINWPHGASFDGRVTDKTGAITPVGAISIYGGAAAPAGWLLCNGAAVSRTVTYADLFAIIGTTYGVGDGSTTFNLPDLRGIFPRGAGTSGKLTDANGAAFAGVLGTYQNDKLQGHKHYTLHSGPTYTGSAGATTYYYGADPDSAPSGSPITDGANGTPRTGAETNPANLGVTFIIKY